MIYIIIGLYLITIIGKVLFDMNSALGLIILLIISVNSTTVSFTLVLAGIFTSIYSNCQIHNLDWIRLPQRTSDTLREKNSYIIAMYFVLSIVEWSVTRSSREEIINPLIH